MRKSTATPGPQPISQMSMEIVMFVGLYIYIVVCMFCLHMQKYNSMHRVLAMCRPHFLPPFVMVFVCVYIYIDLFLENKIHKILQRLRFVHTLVVQTCEQERWKKHSLLSLHLALAAPSRLWPMPKVAFPTPVALTQEMRPSQKHMFL